MKRIIKIGPIQINQPFTVDNFIEVADFGIQNGELFVWVEHSLEDDSPLYSKAQEFLVVGTGQVYEPEWHHTKTTIDPHFGYIWHLLTFYVPC